MINQEWDSEHTQIITVKKTEPEEPDPVSDLNISVTESDSHPIFSLNSANPILPPGKHKQHHDFRASIQFKYLNERGKLNRTTFPEVRSQYWLNKTQMKQGNERDIEQQEEQQKSMEEERHQYGELIDKKKLVYERINNNNYNQLGIGGPSFFCSFFFNTRKDNIKPRKAPVYQYLSKICKDLKPRIRNDDIIKFNSTFESGNLMKVFRSFNEQIVTYELYMHNDINTKGSTQWFFFTAYAEKRIKARFRLINFYKPTSLYMQGMKVLICENNGEWRRLGTSIRYFKLPIDSDRVTYAMEFIYEIQKPNIQYKFSYGYPYTYTDLQNYLFKITQSPLYRKILNKTVLCQTFLGNSVYMLNITERVSDKTQKPIIYIIARQHPGETPASYVAQGLIQLVLSNRLEMVQLRSKFLIKIVPMCNIDGVINGNYRSNFSGNDINRQWWTPSKKQHPEVCYIKQQIYSNRKNVAMFLDIHAHSRKMNSFFYGSGSGTLQNRMYPFVCSKLNKFISFEQSSFNDDPSKRTTARVVLETQSSIKKSLTFEVSFYGYECPEKKIRTHFTRDDLRGLGESLALGLYYSEIGSQKYSQKAIKLKKNIEEPVTSRNSVSCKLNGQKSKKNKKEDIEQKIEKNCRKIMQKWKKQIVKLTKDEQAYSEGSSLDPEHFQLGDRQNQEIQLLSDHLKHIQGKKHSITNFSHPNKEDSCTDDKQMETEINPSGVLIFKNQKLQYGKRQQFSMEGLPSLEDAGSREKGMKSSFRPFHIQSNLRSNIMVKKLESQLQMHKAQSRYNGTHQTLSKQKKSKQNVILGMRFRSIDAPPQKKQQNNYRYNIFEMKKALKYFIQNKNQTTATDYDNFKSNLWASTTSRPLIFNASTKHSETKNRYNRI